MSKPSARSVKRVAAVLILETSRTGPPFLAGNVNDGIRNLRIQDSQIVLHERSNLSRIAHSGDVTGSSCAAAGREVVKTPSFPGPKRDMLTD